MGLFGGENQVLHQSLAQKSPSINYLREKFSSGGGPAALCKKFIEQEKTG
jgi:hypothetical protein